MKKRKIAPILAVSSIAAGIGLSGCGDGWKPTTSEYYDIEPLTGQATDYKNEDNWMYKQTEAKHDVDLLYFYPTVTQEANNLVVSTITQEMKDSAHYAFAETGSAFAGYTNVFAPYYTQMPITIPEQSKIDEYCERYNVDKEKLMSSYFNMLTYTHVRTDVYAALDHYFHYWNKGRPFILAGHSQGSAVLQIILDEYLNVHPELYSKMIAAYSIGFAVSKDLCARHEGQFKFATKSDDTGVVVSWNTTGPDPSASGAIFCKNSLSINPLNWSTTKDVVVDKTQNHGRLMPLHYLHSWTISHDPNDLCDACLKELSDGSTFLINNTITDYETNIGVCGTQSLHTYDYSAYYVNIQENGLERIKAFLGRNPK